MSETPTDGSRDPTLAATLGSLARGRTEATTGLARGDTVGRLVILGRLGEGGMGVVHAAYDPELDRKVALKLLHARGGPSAGGGPSKRLLREAQALAKLSHPNVVAIYDVGEHEGAVWLAMEYVDGTTLGDWLAAQARTWREVLAVLTPAAEGLSAAHRAGLVHRDFKPDNVMVGRDGRVRVMDFGLAHGDSPAIAPRGVDELTRSTHDSLATALTGDGAIVGTPAYMAPEQWLGEPTDPRTDQFSFCVALFEALWRERPFAGDGMGGLALAVVEGKPRAIPSSKVPTWLRRIVLRGLARSPEGRWPDMDALLAALGRGQARALSRKIWLAVAAVGVLAGAGEGARRHDLAQRTHACELEGAEIDALWNDEARTALRRGLVATGVGDAEATADRTVPYFDAQAQAWKAARTQACLDAKVRGTWDAVTFERAQGCLDEREFELEALLGELARADPGAVHSAIKAAAGLASVAPCLDASRLARLPDPPDDRTGIESVRRTLGRAAGLAATANYEEGLAVAEEGFAAAEAIDWPPLTAAAAYRHGVLLEQVARYADAEAALELAYFTAAEAGELEVAAEAALRLIRTVGYLQARHADGRRWWKQAEVLFAMLGEPADGLRRAAALYNLAGVNYLDSRFPEARDLHERALAIREAALGPEHPDVADSLNALANVVADGGALAEGIPLYQRSMAIRVTALGPEHPDVAGSLNNLGGTYFALGDFANALSHNERALAIRRSALGPTHPEVAMSLVNLGNIRYSLGEYDQALRLYTDALAIQERALGVEHPDVAVTLNNVANVRWVTGDLEAARSLYERTLAIRERALGPDHREVAASLNNLANVHMDRGDPMAARPLYERSLAIREAVLGPEHPDLGSPLEGLAAVFVRLGDLEAAKAHYERSLAVRRQGLGPEHPDLAHSLDGLAEVALAQHRERQAIVHAEEAARLRERAGIAPEYLAQSRFLLARALWAAPDGAGRDRERAVELARRAREALTTTEGQAAKLAEVDAWLADRR